MRRENGGSYHLMGIRMLHLEQAIMRNEITKSDISSN